MCCYALLAVKLDDSIAIDGSEARAFGLAAFKRISYSTRPTSKCPMPERPKPGAYLPVDACDRFRIYGPCAVLTLLHISV